MHFLRGPQMSPKIPKYGFEPVVDTLFYNNLAPSDTLNFGAVTNLLTAVCFENWLLCSLAALLPLNISLS